MEHLNINSLQNNEKMNQVNVSKNKVVKGESTNIPKISEDESKKLFDGIETLLPKFIGLFIKDKKKDVANIKFEDIVCKINASTVLIRHKVSKLTLSYKLGQRKIIVNKQHVLNPAQANVFLVWIDAINKDVAESTKIGTYTLEKKAK